MGSVSEVHLTPRQAERLMAAARAARPEEACGALIGTVRRGRVEVERIEPLSNVAAEPKRRYEIDPRQLLDLQRSGRDGGFEVVGYYHSHPSGDAVPSDVDRRSAWPGLSYLICSVDEGGCCRLRSWRLVEGRFVEEAVSTAVRGRRQAPPLQRSEAAARNGRAHSRPTAAEGSRETQVG